MSARSGKMDAEAMAHLRRTHAGVTARPRCPDCNGEASRWGHWHRRYPGWRLYRCAGGHTFGLSHGVVVRVPEWALAAVPPTEEPETDA